MVNQQEKKRILSSSCPSSCPLLKSNMHNSILSLPPLFAYFQFSLLNSPDELDWILLIFFLSQFIKLIKTNVEKGNTIPTTIYIGTLDSTTKQLSNLSPNFRIFRNSLKDFNFFFCREMFFCLVISIKICNWEIKII